MGCRHATSCLDEISHKVNPVGTLKDIDRCRASHRPRDTPSETGVLFMITMMQFAQERSFQVDSDAGPALVVERREACRVSGGELTRRDERRFDLVVTS